MTGGAAQERSAPPGSGRRALRQIWQRHTAVLGLGLAAVVLLGAALAPLLSPADLLAMGPRRLAAPSPEAWLGTDQFGRDLLSRLLFGARVSMVVSFSAVALAATVGGAVGLVAGYLEGKADHLLMRAVDVLMAFPALPLSMAVERALPEAPGVRPGGAGAGRA